MSRAFIGVQVLRFAAAMLVVLMHLTQSVSIYLTDQGGSVYWGQGSAGVDIFFVISGFVMGMSTHDSAPSRAERWRQAAVFAERRLLRVVPLYWFYTLLKAGLLLALPNLAQRYTLEPTHLLASLFFVPVLSPWDMVQPTLPVGWTLNFEMLFYAVFALAIGLGAPRLLFVLTVFGLIYLTQRWAPDSVALGFYAQSLVFEFVLGLVIAKAHQRLRQRVPEAGLLALVLGVVLMFGLPWQSDDDRFGSWGLAAGLIVAGAVWLEPWTRRLKAAKPLVFLGDASYSIYLSHTFVLPAVMLVTRHQGWPANGLLLSVTLVLVVATGSLSYLWLERPMTTALKRLLHARLQPRSPHPPTTAPTPSSSVTQPESSHAKP